VSGAEQQQQQQGGGLRRQAQAGAAAGEEETDPYYGKAIDLESQAPTREPADEGSGLAAAMGGAMLDTGFGLDWAEIAKAEVEVPAGGEPAEAEEEVAGDKGLLGRGAEALTARSHWPFCAWDATTCVRAVG
jgi:hypothetical protein